MSAHYTEAEALALLDGLISSILDETAGELADTPESEHRALLEGNTDDWLASYSPDTLIGAAWAARKCLRAITPQPIAHRRPTLDELLHEIVRSYVTQAVDGKFAACRADVVDQRSEELIQQYLTEILAAGSAPCHDRLFDQGAADEGYNNWTDGLCKDGGISQWVYTQLPGFPDEEDLTPKQREDFLIAVIEHNGREWADD